MVELKQRGWQIDACDERLSAFEYRMRPLMSWINWACIKKLCVLMRGSLRITFRLSLAFWPACAVKADLYRQFISLS